MKWIYASSPGRKIYKLVDKQKGMVVAQVDNQVGGWGCWIKLKDGHLYQLDPFIKRLLIDAKSYVKEVYVRRVGQGTDRFDSEMGKIKEGGEVIPTVT